MESIIPIIVVVVVAILGVIIAWKLFASSARKKKNIERAMKLVTMQIHLPPSTDDIQGGGRDERDVANEEISKAQVMYGILSSTLKKGLINKFYGQRAISFEIISNEGLINYYAVAPAVLTETVRQAITAAYPTARLEEVRDPNFFNKEGGINGVCGGEFRFKKEVSYPISTFQDSRFDASLGLMNAMSTAKPGDGLALQLIIRPSDGAWISDSLKRIQNIKDGKGGSASTSVLSKIASGTGQIIGDLNNAFWHPGEDKPDKPKDPLTNLQQDEIAKLEEKTKFPGFEAKIRVLASANSRSRAEALLGSLVPVFSQFDLPNFNGFKYDQWGKPSEIVRDFLLRNFKQTDHSMVLNSVELASIFHLPSQNVIPTSQVERQLTKQVDGPAKLMDEGIVLGVNEFRGQQKMIRLGTKDRQRHTYIIGGTGMGKSVLLTNLAYQDMCDGRGFCFIDPHGDAIETILSKVPPERMDDVILFDPGNINNPVGMNMFEFQSEDQKDFVVQESLNMMISLYDPGNQGIFGPRAQHMFRNAALLLMSDPKGGTFIDVPRCFTDPEFVKEKLQYVTDKAVYDYWTKEFPASQKSSEAGDLVSWFVSKWGPFLSNKMMRNILGQPKSGFNIREIMDNKKILLVNLSKGRTGEQNAKLLGMIFVMKFQAAAMSRADIPEEERKDFCLFVDEFQNFATDSFESILSEARKFRLNLIVVNQFMTQLTDKIREAILGNCGSIICGRIGVTDAEIMEKVFTPTFTAEDLHKQANFHAIATVMMYNMPTTPFTMKLLPPMGDSNPDLMEKMRDYALSRYGRPRAEVEAEIDERLGVKNGSMSGEGKGISEEVRMPVNSASGDVKKTTGPKKSFLEKWKERKAAAGGSSKGKPSDNVSTPAPQRPTPKPVTVTTPAAPSKAKPVVQPKPVAMSEPMIIPEPEPVVASKPTVVPEAKLTVAPRTVAVPKSEPVVDDVPSSAPAPAQKVEPASESENDPTMLQIPRRETPVVVPATPEPVAAVPAPKPAPTATQSEDGAVFRWR